MIVAPDIIEPYREENKSEVRVTIRYDRTDKN